MGEKSEFVPQSETKITSPFTYQRIDDKEKADYIIPRVLGGRRLEDEEIVELIQREAESRQWFTMEYWRRKGKPVEQIVLTIGDKRVTIYNFNPETPFSDTHIETTQKVLGDLARRFPDILTKIDWILIDNQQLPSIFNDEERYPVNGMEIWGQPTVVIMPRGMQTNLSHRIKEISNFQGTLCHELAHLIEDQFKTKWQQISSWQSIVNHPNWEKVAGPLQIDGSRAYFWVNQQTQEKSFSGQYPSHPEQCITHYARLNLEDDIAESLVAYLYCPEKLKQIAPEKFNLLNQAAAKEEPAFTISAERIPKDKISLPTLPSKTITFFIEEPETKEG